MQKAFYINKPIGLNFGLNEIDIIFLTYGNYQSESADGSINIKNTDYEYIYTIRIPSNY